MKNFVQFQTNLVERLTSNFERLTSNFERLTSNVSNLQSSDSSQKKPLAVFALGMWRARSGTNRNERRDD